MANEKQILKTLIDFFEESQEEDLIGLKIKLILDQQEPTFKKLASQFPDFDAQQLSLNLLLEASKNIRTRRLVNLRNLIENFYKIEEENIIRIKTNDVDEFERELYHE